LLKKDGIDPIKKEAFKLLGAFCIFGYREFYKKSLCIFFFTHQRVYGKESLVPTQILKLFKRLDNELSDRLAPCLLIICSQSMMT
jgi:hypothetical protein